MKRIWIAFLICTTQAPAQGNGERQKITIYVDGEILAPGGIFERARAGAADILRSVGIEVKWKFGSPPHLAASAINCRAGYYPPIGIKIHPEAPSGLIPGTIAGSLPYSVAPTRVHVYVDRIQPMLRKDPDRLPALLAHILVHEIAHVLGGTDFHSDTGIMKAAWSRSDILEMQIKRLSFTPPDLMSIRSGMAAKSAKNCATAGDAIIAVR